MANFMGNRRIKRVRSYSSKRGKYRKSPTGQTSKDVYSKYRRMGSAVPSRVKKQMMAVGGDSIVRKRVTNTRKGLQSVTNDQVRALPPCEPHEIYCKKRRGTNDNPEFDGQGNMVGGWYWTCCPRRESNYGSRSR